MPVWGVDSKNEIDAPLLAKRDGNRDDAARTQGQWNTEKRGLYDGPYTATAEVCFYELWRHKDRHDAGD